MAAPTRRLAVHADLGFGQRVMAAEARTGETDSTLVLMHLLEGLWRNRPDPGMSI